MQKTQEEQNATLLQNTIQNELSNYMNSSGLISTSNDVDCQIYATLNKIYYYNDNALKAKYQMSIKVTQVKSGIILWSTWKIIN